MHRFAALIVASGSDHVRAGSDVKECSRSVARRRGHAKGGRSTGAAIWKWSHRRPHQSTSDHQHTMMSQLARSTPTLNFHWSKSRQIGGENGDLASTRKARNPENPCRSTANTDERTLTAVMAVSHPALCEKSAASIGSNSSAPSGDFS